MTDDPLPPDPPTPARLEYQHPQTALRSRTTAATILKWVVAGVLLLIVAIAFLLPSLNRPTAMSVREECASNLKNIAAALITYSNTHSGRYPDTFEELFNPTGMTSGIFVCPESNDTPATMPTTAPSGPVLTPGHLSYIYLGKGLTTNASADTVLVYEPLSNHKNAGMNVLFGDYSVLFLDAKTATAMLKTLIPGKPLLWPPPTTPATQK